jgi:hypothetical protein
MLHDPKWDKQVVTPALEPWQQECLEAAHAIRKYGWLQHQYGNVVDGFCLVGALRYVGQHEMVDPTTYMKVLAVIKRESTCWNDSGGRTKEQVIEMLETVALKGV